MMVNGRLPLGVVGRVAGDNGPAGDDLAVNLIESGLVSEFDLFAWFLAADDRRVWPKQSDQFLSCGNRFAHHAAHGLVDDLFAGGQQSLQLRKQWARVGQVPTRGPV
jgi:hypothetical protein